MPLEPAETRPRSNFPESGVAFPRYNRRNNINGCHRIFWRNRSSTKRSHTCQHHAEITQSQTFAALIRTSTITHNLLTFNISEISSNSSEKLSLLPEKHLWTFLLHSSYSSSRMQSHTVGRSPQPCFHTRKKVLALVKVHLQFCCHLIHLTPKSLFPRPKTQWSPQKKRTISYLSVSARIRVIDPFSQMKREYNTILDDADSANRNNFVASQSFT